MVLAFNRRGRWDISEPQVPLLLKEGVDGTFLSPRFRGVWGFKIFRGFHSYVRSLCVRVPFFPK